MSKTACSCAKKSETNKEEVLNSRTRHVELSQSLKSPIDHIRFLQRTIGNQAVERLFKSRGLHPKLKIGQPGDVYEQEADRVAEKVLNMPAPAGSMPSVQRVREEEDDIQKKPLAASITPVIQPKADDSFEVGNELESHLVANKGTGSPLPEEVRAYFEPRFGVDFSQVRTHSDLRAAETAQAINARAFTLGNDIVFGAGQYALETSDGKRLLAHELTHVVQQQGTINMDHIQNRHGKSELIEREPDDGGVPSSSPSTATPAPSFSHSAAAAYARTWALSTNPKFGRFDNDCTNFVSQAMLEGGWTMIGGSFSDRTRNDVWWFGKSYFAKASYTWGGAQNFADFVTTSGRGTRAATEMDLEEGDVLQMIFSGSSTIGHSMVVTGKSATDLFMSYHTSDHLNEPLSAIKSRNPSAIYIPWKIH